MDHCIAASVLQEALQTAKQSHAARLASSGANKLAWSPKGRDYMHYSQTLASDRPLEKICSRIFTSVREIAYRFAPPALCQGCYHHHGEPSAEEADRFCDLMQALVPDSGPLQAALGALRKEGVFKLRRCEVARLVMKAVPELRWAREVAAHDFHGRSEIFLLREGQSAVSQLFGHKLDEQANLVFGGDWFERVRQGFVRFDIDHPTSLFRQVEFMAEHNRRIEPAVSDVKALESDLILTLSYRHLIKRQDTKRKNTTSVNWEIATLVASAARSLSRATTDVASDGTAEIVRHAVAYVWIDSFYSTSDDGKWDNEALLPYALFPVVYYRNGVDEDTGRDHERMWLAVENMLARESGLIFTNVSLFERIWCSNGGIVQGKVFKRPDVAVYSSARWICANAELLETHHPRDKEKLLRWALRTAMIGVWPGMWKAADGGDRHLDKCWFTLLNDYGELRLACKLADKFDMVVSDRVAPRDENAYTWWCPNEGVSTWDGMETANSRQLAQNESNRVIGVIASKLKMDYEARTPYNLTLSAGMNERTEIVIFIQAWLANGLISDGSVFVVEEKSRVVCRRDLDHHELQTLANCLTSRDGEEKVTTLNLDDVTAVLQMQHLDVSKKWGRRSLDMDVELDEITVKQVMSQLLAGCSIKVSYSRSEDMPFSRDRYSANFNLKILEWEHEW